jgi:threonine dehydrogenase-like Zn-dependent dehydrogenase
MRGIAAFGKTDKPGLVEVAEPRAPGSGEVLCQTLELGICGTDREILDSQRPHVPPGEEFLILGHECLARVVAVGAMSADEGMPLSDRLAEDSRAAAPIREGDLVVPVVRRALPGRERRVDLLAWGEFTERGIFREHGFSTPLWLDQPRYLFRVPSELESVAVLTEPLAVAAKGINEALVLQQARLGASAWRDVPPRVLVTGLGPIAFAALLMTRIREWPTWMYGRDDPADRRPSVARTLGGEYLPQASFMPDAATIEEDGFDLILECTGSDDVALETAAALRSCGIMVWLGSQRAPKEKPRNFGRLVRDGLVRNNIFLGCVNAAPRDFAESLMRLTQWRIRNPRGLESVITDRVSQREALVHLASRPAGSIKTVVDYVGR